MRFRVSIVYLATLFSISSSLPQDNISLETRNHWMHQANLVLPLLSSPCPFWAFGTVIVNHTDTSSSPHGELVCIGLNQALETGNRILHGEISAINNCSKILIDPHGKYALSPSEAAAAIRDLSLYTNGEPCPMCASAIRQASFLEAIYSTSISSLIEKGFRQITIRAADVFAASGGLDSETRLIPDVLHEESDVFFSWQYAGGKCPDGCAREGTEGKGHCLPVTPASTRKEL